MAVGTEDRCPCQLTGFEGDEAVCRVITCGWDLPRVGFPAAVLRGLGIVPGQWFWWTPTGREVTAGEIDPNGADPFPSEMTDEQKAELERLYEASLKRRNDPWPEYTGDGE